MRDKMDVMGKAISSTETALVRKAILLSWFTIVYNLIEGLVSVGFGVSEESIALAGFGVDSWIEVASATLVLWRFRGEAGMAPQISLDRERKATLGIGILFVILAVMAAIASFLQLSARSHPATTVPGLVISAASLSFMFFLWSSKRKLAVALDSATVMKDAQCSLACIKLSLTLFFGSLLYLSFPALWWADAGAALVLAVLIGKEGLETIEAARREDFAGGCGCAKKCD